MEKRILPILILLIVVFVSFVVLVEGRKENLKPVTASKDALYQPKPLLEFMPAIALKDFFFDKDNFYQAVGLAKKDKPQKNIKAIIAPHHLLASNIIAKMVHLASGRPIKQVIIIGPNHYNIGPSPIITAPAKWETPFGWLEADSGLTSSFLDDFNTISYKEAFVNEHSIGGLAPFVKYYFPQAKILPVVVSSYANYKEAERLSQWLSSHLSKDALIIFSLDFSHYLTKPEAEEKDKITKELILQNDIEKILTLNNDYVDSPAILATSLFLAKKQNFKVYIRQHANSFDYVQGRKPQATTSYFGISFEE
jgi:AmmeMemoRadiSam system protein B